MKHLEELYRSHNAKTDEIHAEKDLRGKIKLYKKYFPGCGLREFRMQFVGYTSDDWHAAAKYWRN